MNRCDYAGCAQLANTDADGWKFCRTHLYEHRRLVGSTVAAGGHLSDLANNNLAGALQPSGNFDALFAALHSTQEAGAA